MHLYGEGETSETSHVLTNYYSLIHITRRRRASKDWLLIPNSIQVHLIKKIGHTSWFPYEFTIKKWYEMILYMSKLITKPFQKPILRKRISRKTTIHSIRGNGLFHLQEIIGPTRTDRIPPTLQRSPSGGNVSAWVSSCRKSATWQTRIFFKGDMWKCGWVFACEPWRFRQEKKLDPS